MELLVAGFDDIKFNVEIALDEQHGALPLPFNGMDSKCLMIIKIRLSRIKRISIIVTKYYVFKKNKFYTIIDFVIKTLLEI